MPGRGASRQRERMIGAPGLLDGSSDETNNERHFAQTGRRALLSSVRRVSVSRTRLPRARPRLPPLGQTVRDEEVVIGVRIHSPDRTVLLEHRLNHPCPKLDGLRRLRRRPP